MSRRTMFSLALSLAIGVVVLNVLARELLLFSYIWWLDLLFHFVGGIALGLAIIFFFSKEGDSLKTRMVKIVLLSSLVAVGWEVFQLSGNSPEFIQENLIPSVSDVLCGVAGALASLFISRR